MNKKIFATAIFAIAAFVSSIASAQINYTNSAAFAGDAQGGNAVAAAGGVAVRANNLILTSTNDGNIQGTDTIIVRLPAGINFSGEPSYLAERAGGATATTGLTLEDDTVFGDPTLDDPKITLNDTNGDGGMDRALVTVSSASTANDTLTISVNLTASSSVDAGTYKASVIVGGNLAVVQEIVDVVDTLSTPVSSTTSEAAKAQSSSTGVGLDTSSATFTVTIPSGTASGTSLTFTPGTGVRWSTGASSTITPTILTPGYNVSPLTWTMNAGVSGGSESITFKTSYASANTNAIQVMFSVSAADSVSPPTTLGLRGLAVGGVVTGNAQIINVLANGSEASISATTPVKVADTKIIAGSTVAQKLPTIQVEENFDTDMNGTITLTAGTGLKFATAGTLAGNSGGSISATSDVITISNLTTGAAAASDTITISGITAVATNAATGNLTVEVDSPAGTDGPHDDVLTVGSAVTLGSADLSISAAQVQKVGEDNYAGTSTVTIKEQTYGAISRANATQVTEAFFRITPSSNADIAAVTISTANYAGGSSPTFSVCETENNVSTGAWICKVTAESTAVMAGTSTVSVQIGYVTDEAVIGDTVIMTFDGNSNVAGELTVANVQISTTAKVTGVIPDVSTGVTTAKTLAKLDIEENFDGAITAGGFFRLVAPSGVAFQDADSVVNSSIGTPTITATFFPNDTLVVPVKLTETLTITPKAVIANGLSGLINFTIFDGDIDGLNKAGVTSEDVMLVHAGELPALDAGDDVSVNAGFSATNSITGGLAPYTASSAALATVGTPTVSGSSVSVKGKAVGNTTITVKDSLNAPVTFDVAVTMGATQTMAVNAPKAIGGDAGSASFTAGATTDGGDSYGTEFTTADDVTVLVTANVDANDQGTDGEIYVLVLSTTDDGATLATMDADGNFTVWDQTVAGLAAAEVAEPLGASHTVEVFNGNLAAGTHRIAVGYSAGNKIVFTGKALVLTVTE